MEEGRTRMTMFQRFSNFEILTGLGWIIMHWWKSYPAIYTCCWTNIMEQLREIKFSLCAWGSGLLCRRRKSLKKL